jgi:putative transposase
MWTDGRVKVRENQRVINKAVYLALGVTMEGQKELLGMWMSANEGAKFWLSVFTELQNRGMKDCFVACVDGLTGLPEAIEAVFPREPGAVVHAPHGSRNSLKYVSYKHRKAVATDLKAIYGAATEAEAEFNLELKAREMGSAVSDHQHVVAGAVGARDPALCFLRGYSASVIYTTNATPSVNMTDAARSRAITAFFLPMRRSTKSSTWQCRTLPRNGPCPFATGSRR